jgi:hypothetical protein
MAFGETISPGEAEQFRGLAQEIAAAQKERADKGLGLTRALHVKQHIGAVGELVVTAPEGARHGVFAEVGKKYAVYARFSNGSGRRQKDGVLDVRGFALKLVGVPGKKLIEGMEDELTQDFLLIDTPALPVRHPGEFMALHRAAKDGPLPLLPRLIGGVGLGRALGILSTVAGARKVRSYATHDFHTGAPVAFGDTAAKLGLFPPSGVAEGRASGPNYLADDLVARLAAGPLIWTLRAQRFVDQASTPIEDASIAWSGPWVDVATVTLPRQDVRSPKGNEISELVSQLSFDPWHAGEEHRPLGAIMRARRVAYAPSVIARKALPEPRSVLSL